MRTLPRRRYIYRDPDTGREFMCWRGEALDRVLRFALSGYFGGALIAREDYEAICKVARYWWPKQVRLRAPLANPVYADGGFGRVYLAETGKPDPRPGY